MFSTRLPRIFLLWGEGQKGRNAYTQAYALAREADRTLGTDVPYLIGQKPINRIKAVAPNRALPKSKTETQALSEELLGNDSLGG